MWRHTFELKTDAEPEKVWRVLANVADWPSIDENIASIAAPTIPALGARFKLQPRGGPPLSFEIVAFEPPRRYADRCRMPFATMTTTHEVAAGRISALIEIEGPLARFWGATVGKTHARGLPKLMQRMADAAKSG